MDEIDMAQVQEEGALRAVGYCYSCHEQLADARRFCNRDCLDDWERVEAARRRNGA
jgi:hypothetical protein